MIRPLIAMSGGVDSSVCAAVILEQGLGAVGATMRLFCAEQKDIDDAKAVCDRLGIEHFCFDMADGFEQNVICRFIDAYEKGITPNPCIDCNRFMKFGSLLEAADKLGCTHIVTGHYARIEREGDRFLLKKGLDENKDQSYVLYSLTQNELSRIILPLGGMTKAQVREKAASLGFINSDKKDSQDICFVKDGDYAKFIEEYTGKSYPCGPFKDEDGNILGTHRGIIRYTIGQRKGLGLALPAPLYVKSKNTLTNEVILCPDEGLYTDTLIAKEFNWITFEDPVGSFRAEVKTRYKSKPASATVIPVGKTSVKIIFDQPQRAITPGQAAVVYNGDTVVGGGTII